MLDFIDMKGPRDRREVYNRMRDGLRKDKSKTHVLPISDLGLMEMTRQRQSESVRDAAYTDCDHCSGRGKLKSALTMSVDIQRKLGEIIKKRDQFEQRREQESDFNLRVNVHPTVLERLRNEDEDIFIDMDMEYDWGVPGLPTTFLISPKGEMLYRAVGKRDFSSERMEMFFTKIVNDHFK
mgnify:CR=1 FL=1